MSFRVIQSDSLTALREMADNSIDSLVTDPPAGIDFMGRDWDNPASWDVKRDDRGFPAILGSNVSTSGNPKCRACGNHQSVSRTNRARGVVPCVCEVPDFDTERMNERRRNFAREHREKFVDYLGAILCEVYRVLKPGAHGVVWALPRTSHWTATALEDSGFEIRDVVTHLFGSGFPKSLDVSKAIDKQLGAQRERTGRVTSVTGNRPNGTPCLQPSGIGAPNAGLQPAYETSPATEEAKRWHGFGTALKPASEHWIVVRKPLGQKNVAVNVLTHGTGALNIEGCRVPYASASDKPSQEHWNRFGSAGGDSDHVGQKSQGMRDAYAAGLIPVPSGRYPANVIFSHHALCEPVGSTIVDPRGGPASGPSLREPNESPSRGRFNGLEEGREPAYYPAERVTVWRCAPGCPVADLDEQSGESKSTPSKPSENPRPIYGGASYFESRTLNTATSPYDDAGGASRFFRVFAPEGAVAHDASCERVEAEVVPQWECVPGCPVAQLDAQSGQSLSTGGRIGKKATSDVNLAPAGAYTPGDPGFGDRGGASRFFYVAKPSSDEKHGAMQTLSLFDSNPETKPLRNSHPTVKPVELMRYLCRLVTPPGGTVVDPFAGSGTTGVAALAEGFDVILIERDPDSAAVALARVERAAIEGGRTMPT